MSEMHISQQRKIKLLHRNASTTQSRWNSNGRRHGNLTFTGKLTNLTSKEITVRVNRNNHLENSNMKKCNRLKLKGY